MLALGNSWDSLLLDELKKPYYSKIHSFLKSEYASHNVYPNIDDIFNSLKYTAYEDVRVVILGQDPYHQPKQAHGLAFSVNIGVKTPPSLQNIFKEIHSDIGCYIPNNGFLKKWADQGVLLLNSSLTVRENEANSHQNIGWQQFTDNIISLLNQRNDPLVFLLWGNNAKKKLPIINNPKHKVLQAAHPSPLSATKGFFGCKHFSKTNEMILGMEKMPIDWQIEDVRKI